MNNKNTNILFVQGPEKTATSTMTGILNCHPEIFILFENYVAQSAITKYGHQFLERYPGARSFYRTEKDYGKPLLDIFNYLGDVEPDFNYHYAGTKINSLDPGITQREKSHKIIYMMRDIRSWLVKESIVKLYRTDLDVVVPAIEYTKYIIQTGDYAHSKPVWLEDLILKNDEILQNLSEYLGVDLTVHADEWWKKIAKRPENDPKNVFLLNHVHHSSRIKPEKIDTEFTLKQVPFWQKLLPVFNRYYLNRDITAVPAEQRARDIACLDELKTYSPLPITECYSEFKSIRFGFSKPRETYYLSKEDSKGQKRSLLNRIKKRLKRIKYAAFGDQNIKKRWVFGLTFYDEALLMIEVILVSPIYY